MDPHRTRRLVLAVSLASLVAGAMVPSATLASGGLFLPYRAIGVPSEPDAIAIGDVTGDGRADVVVTTGYDFDPADDFHLLVLAQTASGDLAAPVSYATSGSYTARPGSVGIGDVDGDGRNDVVVGLDRYGVELFPQQPDGTLGPSSLALNQDSTRIRVGPIDKTGRPQVAGIGWGTNTVTIFAVNGAGLIPTRTYPVPHDGWDDIELADVTSDGLPDLVVMSGQGLGPNFHVVPQLANGTFGPAVPYDLGSNESTNGIGVGDVTGDGRTDVVASFGGNRPTSGMAVFAQSAGGSLAAPASIPSLDIPEPVEVADFDRDGRNDVVTLHGGWQKAGVDRGQADGTLGAEELYDLPYASHYSVHGLAVGDINGDGWPDAVAADYNNGVIVLINAATAQPKPPGAPSLTRATPDDRLIGVQWAPPADDGGSTILSYTATAAPGGQSCTTVWLSCVISGLENGTAYSVTVRATNAVGTGQPSNMLQATPGVAPSAPRSLAASPNLAAGVGLTWQEPFIPGSPALTGYRIYRGAPGATPSLLAIVGNVTAYTDTAVATGTSYVYQVAAVNAFSEGPRTAELTTARGTAPSAPRGLSAATGGQGITLKWSLPAADGGSPVTGLRVYRGTTVANATVVATLSATTTSFVDKGVARKTAYVYWVSALNVLGEGPASNTVAATSR